jgi:hypothetical protein
MPDSISLDIETFLGAIMDASYLDIKITASEIAERDTPSKEMGHVGPGAVPAVRR